MALLALTMPQIPKSCKTSVTTIPATAQTHFTRSYSKVSFQLLVDKIDSTKHTSAVGGGLVVLLVSAAFLHLPLHRIQDADQCGVKLFAFFSGGDVIRTHVEGDCHFI